MKANTYKATFILAAVSCGFFITYPFANGFWGGLLSRGFGAAMIGGLADWFAVSALFRRPLGIPFRTAIIPRNRERIFQALVHMVEHEILMKENIKSRLNEYDLSATVLYFLTENNNVRQDGKRLLYRFWQDFSLHIVPEELEPLVAKLVKESMEEVKLITYIVPIFEWLLQHGYDDKMIDIAIEQCMIAVDKESFIRLLADVFADVTRKYEQGMNRRKLFNLLMDVSPKQLARGAKHGLMSLLREMKNADHPLRLEVKSKVMDFTARLTEDRAFGNKAEAWLRKNIIDKFRLGEKAGSLIIALYNKVSVNNKLIVRGLDSLILQLDVVLEDFSKNREERNKVDGYLKAILGEWLDTHHNEIGRIARDSLNEFTNEKLIYFIENKVGNDLQMIRINGSLVGGMAGMALYLLTYWL